MGPEAKLAGMAAIVTGGSGAIGSESALRLLEDGAAVLLMGRRQDILERAKAKLLRAVPEGTVELFSGDAGNVDDVQAGLDKAFAMRNRLDVIVAGVGKSDFRPILMHDLDSFMSNVAINLATAFLAIRYGAPRLTQGSSIICISSAAAGNVTPWMASYMAGKGAMEQLMRCAAEELASAGIRVNAIRPGVVRTELGQTMSANGKIVEEILREVPLGRVGEPFDISGAVRYLAGPESAWVTGQVITVDGGSLLRKNPRLMEPLIERHGRDRIEKVLRGEAP